MKLALVFPGQGSQSVGMMQAYGDAPVVRATFDEASAALGENLWRLAAEGPGEAQALTVNTQPLMLAAGVAAYRLWREQGGAEPAAGAGHSLGEYSALVAAGVLQFSDAVPLVRLRAQAMQEAVPAGAGAMAAILGLDEEGASALRRFFWVRYGTTMRGLVRHHGEHPARFIRETHKFPELSAMVVGENALGHALARLGWPPGS